jgi:hypothetical protein
LSKLKGIVKNVKATLSQDEKPTPMVLNHTKEANPYKSKFEEEEWKQRLTESSGVHRYRSVMDLAEYMVAEGYLLFLDGNFWFYHNALSLLTAKQTRQERQEKGYLKHWILPELGLNKKTIYAKRPPGNSPEMMPWDCTLNNLLVEAVMRHMSVSSFASPDKEKKFKLNHLTEGCDACLSEVDGMGWGRRLNVTWPPGSWPRAKEKRHHKSLQLNARNCDCGRFVNYLKERQAKGFF